MLLWGAFGQQGATIVPEIFLRGYDPVTVFFPETVGPNAAEPADDPGVLLQIEPEHPGEYRWLDSKTLQFLPTVRWPALRRFTITANGLTHTLVTLMAAPKSISPSERQPRTGTDSGDTTILCGPAERRRVERDAPF